MTHLGRKSRAEKGGHTQCRPPERGEGFRSRGQSQSLRSRPVISSGDSMPNKPNTVGATSRKDPPGRSEAAPVLTATRGTGFVVWAVWTPPVAGSTIISQFP